MSLHGPEMCPAAPFIARDYPARSEKLLGKMDGLSILYLALICPLTVQRADPDGPAKTRG